MCRRRRTCHRTTACRCSGACPGRSYTSEAEFARERDRVLLPGWFCVGRADGLTEPGCYLAADVCGESILVTRTDGGGLAGHFNLCRHRGSRLVPQPIDRGPGAGPPAPGAGSLAFTAARWPAAGFPAASAARTTPGRTPWTGRCARAVPARAAAAPGRAGLHPVDMASWGGLVFARLDRRPAGRRGTRSRPRSGRCRPGWPPIRWRPAQRRPAALRRGRQLEGDPGELQRVLSLRAGPPGAVRAGAGFRRGGGDLDWDAGIPHRPGATTFTSTGTTRRAPFPGLYQAGRTRHSASSCCPT